MNDDLRPEELPAEPSEPTYAEALDALPELTDDERRVIERAQPGVPVWGWWGLGLAGAALLVTLGARATAENGESIARLRNHAARYEGRLLRVRGHVGEVFEMGGSRVYYLLQGKDTLVVFTRGEAPQPGKNVSIQGTLSVGYLDGAPRAALFEVPE